MNHAASATSTDIQVSYAGLDDLGMVVVVDGKNVQAWSDRSLTTVEHTRMLANVRRRVAELAAAERSGSRPLVLFVRRSAGRATNGAASDASGEEGDDGHVHLAESSGAGAAPGAGHGPGDT